MLSFKLETMMRYRYLTAVILLACGLVGGGMLLLHGHQFAVLNPEGPVAHKELQLIIFASLLSLVVVVPVFAMTIGIAWKYRAGNTKARYTPDWDGNRLAEIIWWLVPTILIGILAVVITVSTQTLDPGQALASSKPTLTIQVVALPWKWLFIYPDQRVASVNFVQLPVGTPVRFEITGDAPMNSFWIPQLGGQIYAMTGMSTELNLMATTSGDYRGLSANLSGQGFSGMTFIARAGSETDFHNWIQTAQTSSQALNVMSYNALAKPSQNNQVKSYTLDDPTLYDEVVMKYMAPSTTSGLAP